MTVKWVHGAGEDPVGRCLQCWEDEDGSVVHPAELDEDSDPEEPWCAVCGHHIDIIEILPETGERCDKCQCFREIHVPDLGCLGCECGDRGQVP